MKKWKLALAGALAGALAAFGIDAASSNAIAKLLLGVIA